MGLLIGLLIFGLVAGLVLAIVFVAHASREQKKAEADAPARLDQIFSGDEVVTYTAGGANLTYETVVRGALERGYDLYSKESNERLNIQKLVFKKQA